MEYMRIEDFLANSVSKMINKGLQSKLGFKPNITLNAMNMLSTGENDIDLNISVRMSKSDFSKLIEEVTK